MQLNRRKYSYVPTGNRVASTNILQPQKTINNYTTRNGNNHDSIDSQGDNVDEIVEHREPVDKKTHN